MGACASAASSSRHASCGMTQRSCAGQVPSAGPSAITI